MKSRSEMCRLNIRELGAAKSNCQGPNRQPFPLTFRPGADEIARNLIDRIPAVRDDETLCCRPGAEISEQMIQRPAHFNLKRWSRQFLEREWQIKVTAPHHLSFGRPIRTDDFVVKLPNERIDLRRDSQFIVSPSRQDPA